MAKCNKERLLRSFIQRSMILSGELVLSMAMQKLYRLLSPESYSTTVMTVVSKVIYTLAQAGEPFMATKIMSPTLLKRNPIIVNLTFFCKKLKEWKKAKKSVVLCFFWLGANLTNNRRRGGRGKAVSAKKNLTQRGALKISKDPMSWS